MGIRFVQPRSRSSPDQSASPRCVLGAAQRVAEDLDADPLNEECVRRYQCTRHDLARLVLECSESDLPLIANSPGWRAFVQPAHRDIPCTTHEVALRASIPVNLAKRRRNPFRWASHLLCAMLYFAPHELEPSVLFEERSILTCGIFPAFVHYLGSLRECYTREGDADRHVNFLEGALVRIVEWLRNCEPQGIGTFRDLALLAAFMDHYAGGIRLCNHSSLKTFFTLEKQALALLAGRVVDPSRLQPLEPVRAGNHGRLRVGLLGRGYDGDLRYSLPSFALLPADRFEVHVFTPTEVGSDRALLHPDVEFHTLSLRDLVGDLNLIRSFKLDIIVYGSYFFGLLDPFAILLHFRGAPIQSLYCGDVVTSGLETVDYFIVGETYVHNRLQAEFTEQILACPGIGYGFPVPPVIGSERGEARRALGLSEGTIAYVSNAHLFKLTPELLSTWVQILRQQEKAMLVLMPLAAEGMRPYYRGLLQTLRAVCDRWSVAPERIQVRDVQGQRSIMAVLHAGDVYLDSFPYSGPSSTLEALALGVPVVTLAGRTFRGDLVAGLLRELGLEEYAARDRREYVDRAIALGRSRQQRESVRQLLPSRLSKARFFDPATITQDLAMALTRMATSCHRESP